MMNLNLFDAFIECQASGILPNLLEFLRAVLLFNELIQIKIMMYSCIEAVLRLVLIATD